jgi:hypothetical protein
MPTTPRYARRPVQHLFDFQLPGRREGAEGRPRALTRSLCSGICPQAFLNAWSAACGSSEDAVLAAPAGKAYRIWPVQLFGPCRKKLKLLVRISSVPYRQEPVACVHCSLIRCRLRCRLSV